MWGRSKPGRTVEEHGPPREESVATLARVAALAVGFLLPVVYLPVAFAGLGVPEHRLLVGIALVAQAAALWVGVRPGRGG